MSEGQGTFVADMCTFMARTRGTAWKEADYFSYHFSDVWRCSEEEVMPERSLSSAVVAFLVPEWERFVVLRHPAAALAGCRSTFLAPAMCYRVREKQGDLPPSCSVLVHEAYFLFPGWGSRLD